MDKARPPPLATARLSLLQSDRLSRRWVATREVRLGEKQCEIRTRQIELQDARRHIPTPSLVSKFISYNGHVHLFRKPQRLPIASGITPEKSWSPFQLGFPEGPE